MYCGFKLGCRNYPTRFNVLTLVSGIMGAMDSYFNQLCSRRENISARVDLHPASRFGVMQ